MTELSPDKRVEITLAEFNALRTEICNRTTIQVTLLGTGITATGVVAGFALGKDANTRLLVLLPLIAGLSLILFLNESLRVHQIGDYIRTQQFVKLRELQGSVPSWEDHVKTRNASSGPLSRLLDAPIDILLLLVSALGSAFADGIAVWIRLVALLPVIAAVSVHLYSAIKKNSRLSAG